MGLMRSTRTLLVLLVGATLLSGYMLSSSIVVADDTVIDDVSVSVAVSCTMSSTGSNTHNANMTNGTYQSEIGTTTLKAFCNDNEGFAIYAIGFTGDQYTGEDHTKLIGINSNQKISTGTASSGGTSNWAMKLNTISSPTPTYPITLDNGYGSYSSVPDTYAKVAHRDSGTDVGVSATGSELTATYATYISGTQAADTYSGKVKYTLVHPASETPLAPQPTQSGKICYYPNGSNVEGTMGCQTLYASSANATLLASNFSRTGYGFAGWSTTFDYSDSTGFYGPQELITFTAGEYTGNNPGLSLYARWIKSTGYLQNWTCPNNTSMPIGAVTALTDRRDDQTYAVAKLADSKCWMIENLRLENTGTDNTNGLFAQGYDASFVGLANPESPWADNSTTANSLYSTDGSTTKTISGSNLAYRFPRYNSTNTNARASTPSDGTGSMYSYGNYYTWAAAIADITDYSSGDHSTTSICPTGWRIPTGNVAGEFYALNTAINSGAIDSVASRRLRAYPNNFVLSGGVTDSSVLGRGSSGGYWSSTVLYGIYSCYFGLRDSSVSPGTDNNGQKHGGKAIRCVASNV